jgi:hypothetical protein
MDNNIEERIKHRASELKQAKGDADARIEDFMELAEKQIRGETETYERIKQDRTVETNS